MNRGAIHGAARRRVLVSHCAPPPPPLPPARPACLPTCCRRSATTLALTPTSASTSPASLCTPTGPVAAATWPRPRTTPRRPGGSARQQRPAAACGRARRPRSFCLSFFLLAFPAACVFPPFFFFFSLASLLVKPRLLLAGTDAGHGSRALYNQKSKSQTAR